MKPITIANIKYLVLIFGLLFIFSKENIAQIQAPRVEDAECASCGVRDDNGKLVQMKCGESIVLTKNGQKYTCTCKCGKGGGLKCVPVGSNQNQPLNLNPPASNGTLDILNSGIDLINALDKPTPSPVKDKQPSEEDKKTREYLDNKHNNVSSMLKPLDPKPNALELKNQCMKAQREVYRLLTLKIKFENQLFELGKWNKDLDTLTNGFKDDKVKYVEGWDDDLLNLMPIEKIKGLAKTASDGEKVEKAFNAIKMGKSSAEKFLKSNESSTDDLVNSMQTANENYTYLGGMVENMAIFAPGKSKDFYEKAGKCLQLNGASLGLVKDGSYENIGNQTVDGLGLFIPIVGITAAGTRLSLKATYEIYSDYQIHKLATIKSENQKAQDFLKSKIEQLEKDISKNQEIVDNFTKTHPGGCPVESYK